MPEIRGIDISEKQGAVNWDRIQEAVRRAEIAFVSVRAGFGVRTSGGTDDQFVRNWAELRRRNIPRNAYFFAYPGARAVRRRPSSSTPSSAVSSPENPSCST